MVGSSTYEMGSSNSGSQGGWRSPKRAVGEYWIRLGTSVLSTRRFEEEFSQARTERSEKALRDFGVVGQLVEKVVGRFPKSGKGKAYDKAIDRLVEALKRDLVKKKK